MELGKIMVVDDDKNICELLRLYLEKEGYQVVIANDGKEAVELNEKEDPELILLDIMLPQLDGWQVCRESGNLRCRLLCLPPRARCLTRCWAWNWEPTITL